MIYMPFITPEQYEEFLKDTHVVMVYHNIDGKFILTTCYCYIK